MSGFSCIAANWSSILKQTRGGKVMVALLSSSCIFRPAVPVTSEDEQSSQISEPTQLHTMEMKRERRERERDQISILFPLQLYIPLL